MIETRGELYTLIPEGALCVELGTAKGLFSEWLLRNAPTITLISIDIWNRGRHNDDEARRARERLSAYGNRSIVLRALFQEAAGWFPNSCFDFIYIDGFAHRGPAQTIQDWYPKAKPGAFFGGHDYHERWPRVIRDVDHWAETQGYQINLTEKCRYPSWWVLKHD